MAYPSKEVLKSVYTTLQLSSNTINECKCEIFPLVKSQKLPLTHSHKHVTTPFELLYMDLRASPIVSITDACYFLLMMDDFSHY